MLKSRTIAIAGSIAALSLAAVPIAGAATTQHAPARAEQSSRDARTGRSADKRTDLTRPDRVSVDRSRDVRNR